MIRVCYDVGVYRRALSEIVGCEDTVLEIGPHRGKSTDAYHKSVKQAVLVDKGTDCIEALERYAAENENIIFVCGDARSFDTVSLVLRHINACDIFACDMGGGRYPDTVFKVWATWAGIFKPKHSIIRCRGLAEFLRRAKVDDDTLPQSFEESGWLESFGRKTPASYKKQLDEFSNWVDI